MSDLVFDRDFDPRHGEAVPLSPLVTRVTVNNPGPFTFHGTNTYLIGRDTLAIVDPGPVDDAHADALVRAVAGRPVSHVVVTHTHADHSPLARPLADRLGAALVGCAPHRTARPLAEGETNVLDASGDRDYRPDAELDDGATISGDGWTLETIATPGHTINHLAFRLVEENALLAGDHVMAWSTSIVAPPDGQMRAYMDSLDRVHTMDFATLWPGHGGPVSDPARFIPGLIAHRKGRETAALEALKAGPATVAQMVPRIYEGLPPMLHGAAALSLFAHMEDLAERGLIEADGPPVIDAVWRLRG